MNAVESLQKNFNDQLTATNNQLEQMRQQTELLVSRREQLKGALYALGAIGEQEKAEAAAAAAGTKAPDAAAPSDAAAPAPTEAAPQEAPAAPAAEQPVQ